MTNKEIVDMVFREYNVVKMIEKLITSTKFDKTSEDLAQQIYIILLKTNHNRLKKLFYKNELKAYINRIILNNRNYYRSYLNIIRSKNIELTPLNSIDIVDDRDTYEERSEREDANHKRYLLLVEVFKNNNFTLTGQTDEQMEMCQAISILSEYMGIEIIGNESVFKEPLNMKELSNIYYRDFKNGKRKKREVREIKRLIVLAMEHIKKNIK